MVESYVDARSSKPSAEKRRWSRGADVRISDSNTSASKERQTLRNDDVKSGSGRRRSVDHCSRRWSEIPISTMLTFGCVRSSREHTSCP